MSPRHKKNRGDTVNAAYELGGNEMFNVLTPQGNAGGRRSAT